MKLLSVTLGIILCLFTISIASAECAWVLWTKTEKTISVKDKTGVDYSVRWELLHAVPTYEQCLQMLNDAVARNGRIYTEGKSEGGFQGINITVSPGYILLTGEELTHSIEYKCFPDTIDPRK